MPRNKTILITNQKGGTGKTTIATELGFAAARAGIQYSYYDLDKQGGGTHDDLTAENPVLTIVDTPGALEMETAKWMKSADLLIIPTRLSPRDVPALETMKEIISANHIKAPVIYVLNGWNRFRASSDFEEWFKLTYPKDRTVVIPQSELFVQAAATGRSVCDYRTSNFPRQQIEALLNMVEDILHVGLIRKEKTNGGKAE